VNDQRVAGVITALEAHNNVRLAGEQVDYFPFAFVAPLGADDCDVCHCVRQAIGNRQYKDRSRLSPRASCLEPSPYNLTRVAETICGRARSSSSAFLATASST